MALGWQRVRVVFENHETLAGFLEKEDDRGITVLVMAPETSPGVPGLHFFPWTSIVSIYNVDSKKELKKRQKVADAAAAAKKPRDTPKEFEDEQIDWVEVVPVKEVGDAELRSY